MKRIIETLTDVTEQKGGFRFDQPWRYSDETVIAVLPILRDNGQERGYVTLIEAQEDVEIVDVGKVNEMRIVNKGTRPVFVRAGEMLKGGTQERAVFMSQILMPGVALPLEVVCVHRVRPLSTGTRLKTDADYVPSSVYRRTGGMSMAGGMSANLAQSGVWMAIQETSETYAAQTGPAGPAGAAGARFETMRHSDDIAAKQDSYADLIADVINKVPRLDSQVGFAVIGLDGVLAIEFYDAAASWEAVREGAIKQHGEDLGKVLDATQQVFEYLADRAFEAVKDTMSRDYEFKEGMANDAWSTQLLNAPQYSGEATVLSDEVIHLMIARQK